jgi:hypothetical protein
LAVGLDWQGSELLVSIGWMHSYAQLRSGVRKHYADGKYPPIGAFSFRFFSVHFKLDDLAESMHGTCFSLGLGLNLPAAGFVVDLWFS